MPILLFINLKGGVAKTTNAVAVAECLAEAGNKVLVIDADHQCMAGELLLGETRLLQCEGRKRTLHDMLAAMLDPEFVADHISGYIAPNASNIGGGLQSLFVMPCSIRIDDFSTNMAKARHGYKSTEEFQSIFDSRRRQIRTWLNNKYDFTIIDCPPSVALQVRMFLPIADGLIVPSVPDRLSVRGSLYLLDRIRRMGIKTQAYGTLWSLFRKQNSTHCRIVEATAKGVEPFNQLPRPFETIIPNASAIVEATEIGQTPASFNAKYSHSFAKLFHDLCDEIVARSTFSENGRQVQKVLATKSR